MQTVKELLKEAREKIALAEATMGEDNDWEESEEEDWDDSWEDSGC